MTARRSFLNDGKRRFAFFANSLRRSWSVAIWYFIGAFLAGPIFLLLTLPTERRILSETDIHIFIREIMPYRYFVLTTCVLLACLSGFIAMRYLMEHRSSYFYHSLPHSRATVYTTAVVTKGILLPVAMIVNGLITFLIFASRGALPAFPTIVSFLYDGLNAYFLFYALTVFAGAVAGTTVMQIGTLGYILGIFPLLYVTVVTILFKHAAFTNASYYAGSKTAYAVLSPLTRLFVKGGSTTTLADKIAYPLIALLFFFLAYLLIRARGAEESGNPLVFRHVGEVMKLSFLFPLTYWSGELFRVITSSDGWRLFGFALGLVLGFMAMNLMITLNARKMFAGWKKAIVFVVLFAAFVSLGEGNVLTNDRYLPREKNVTSVTANVNGDRITSSDPSVIAAALEMTRAGFDTKVPSGLVTIDDAGDIVWDIDIAAVSDDSIAFVSDEDYVEVFFKTKCGITVAKSVWVPTEKVDGFLTALVDSGEYYRVQLERVDEVIRSCERYYIESSGTDLLPLLGLDVGKQADNITKEILRAYRNDLAANRPRGTSPAVATIWCQIGGAFYSYESFTVKLCDEETLTYLLNMAGISYTGKVRDYILDFATSCTVSLKIEDAISGETTVVTDPEKIREIFTYSDCIYAYAGGGDILDEICTRYTCTAEYCASGHESDGDSQWSWKLYNRAEEILGK